LIAPSTAKPQAAVVPCTGNSSWHQPPFVVLEGVDETAHIAESAATSNAADQPESGFESASAMPPASET
jgi:hypothetical protein